MSETRQGDGAPAGASPSDDDVPGAAPANPGDRPARRPLDRLRTILARLRRPPSDPSPPTASSAGSAGSAGSADEHGEARHGGAAHGRLEHGGVEHGEVEPSGVARVVDRLRARWAAIPLRARLVGLITLLLTSGLLIAGATTAALLERYLVGQVDARLRAEAVSLADRQLDALQQRYGCDVGSSTLLPSDYSVIIRVGAALVTDCGRPVTYETFGTPNVPLLTPTEASRMHGEPFTVASTRADSSWRVVAYPFTVGANTFGTVTVALPLGEIQHTVDRIVLLLVSSGLAIVVLGALVGDWAVKRSLRPLREIETTAAAIAAGDLSERVPAAPTQTEVGRLSAALNGMLSQIEEAFADRTASEGRMRRFVADASHELRTPLAAIRGYGELYRMGALTERDQVDDTMRRIEQSATRMGALVEDLLALARLDERRGLRTELVDMAVLAADAMSDLHALDPERPVRLGTLDGTGRLRPCAVVGDDRMIRQVLSNLVGNVVAHTPAGSPVEIALGQRDGSAVLEVRDHGPGIDPEHAARVFERFYRVDASRSRSTGPSGTGGGAGLGMAIVAAIVSAHGGTVAIDRTPGGGTTVRVWLPLADLDGPAGEHPSLHQGRDKS